MNPLLEKIQSEDYAGEQLAPVLKDGVFTCPHCGTSHRRGPVNGVDGYRCLNCGNSTRVEVPHSGERRQTNPDDHELLARQLWSIGQHAAREVGPSHLNWDDGWSALRPWIKTGWLAVAKFVFENYDLKEKGGAK